MKDTYKKTPGRSQVFLHPLGGPGEARAGGALRQLMLEATRLTRSGRLGEATAVIQRALRGGAASVRQPAPTATPASGKEAAGGTAASDAKSPAESLVLDGCVFEVDTPAPAAATVDTGQFIHGSHTHAALTRHYKLYIPPGANGRALPLVVMLHGCTQDPDDFATGTGMNERARAQGFFVLYPAQSQDANPSRCWNWFKHNHQRRAGGEAALLASMAQAVTMQYGMDARRVYVAGLSAGGAMAAIVANVFPEVFAAVGIHSGLAQGAAGTMVEALAAMKSGGAGRVTAPAHASVPTIVFHGDQDQTVHPRNGEQVIAAAVQGTVEQGSTRVEHGVSSLGRRYTRTVHQDALDRAVAEHWLVHGAGHAWSGGQAHGSYTDPKGPNATDEMLRFFLGSGDRLGQNR